MGALTSLGLSGVPTGALLGVLDDDTLADSYRAAWLGVDTYRAYWQGDAPEEGKTVDTLNIYANKTAIGSLERPAATTGVYEEFEDSDDVTWRLSLTPDGEAIDASLEIAATPYTADGYKHHYAAVFTTALLQAHVLPYRGRLAYFIMKVDGALDMLSWPVKIVGRRTMDLAP